MRKVAGFTIIELVVVITILGILAAVALPKFFDLQDDARRASVQGFAGAAASGAALNYGAFLAQGGIAGSATAVAACNSATVGALLTGGFPANITVADAAATPLTTTLSDGAVGFCTFAHAANAALTATVGLIKAD